MLEGWLWLLATLAVFIAGLSKGGFGSAIGFVSSAILAVVLEPTHALALMMPLLLLMDFLALKPYWKRWDGPTTRVLTIGSVFGCIGGVLLFSVISADALRLMIGAIALLFPLFQLARAKGWISPQPRDFSSRDGIFAGIAAGFTSFISHAGGPAAAVFMLSQRNVGKTLY
ncbi:MAG: sulfite exporter TauE/SafE family protein, partial [Alphaproteobacteria bacterium]|nr:sulfite exporter TauE/SafE family protein [Alphaproteobacteria bacterium]